MEICENFLSLFKYFFFFAANEKVSRFPTYLSLREYFALMLKTYIASWVGAQIRRGMSIEVGKQKHKLCTCEHEMKCLKYANGERSECKLNYERFHTNRLEDYSKTWIRRGFLLAFCYIWNQKAFTPPHPQHRYTISSGTFSTWKPFRLIWYSDGLSSIQFNYRAINVMWCTSLEHHEKHFQYRVMWLRSRSRSNETKL